MILNFFFKGNAKKKTEKEMLVYVKEYKKEKKENQIYNGRKKDDNLQVKEENKILFETVKSQIS